jgi:hypothetical protein
MLSESLLKNLCSQLGVVSSSMMDVCHILDIRIVLNEYGKTEIKIPPNLLANDYVARGRLCKEIEESFNKEQVAIERIPQEIERMVLSYPYPVKSLVLSLSRFSIEAEKNNQESSKNFLHNARWLLVPVKDERGMWHHADLRTLWSDGWREQDIIRFMMSKPVKYIVHHNAEMIECLDLNNQFYTFKKETMLL